MFNILSEYMSLQGCLAVFTEQDGGEWGPSLPRMSYSRRSGYSESPSPYRRYKRSVSLSISRSRSRSRSPSVENPGNNLYVTGLSVRVTRRDLEKHFSAEGKVEDVHLVVDPRTKESRGFGFVTMSSLEEADRCIKYLDGSVLEGRVITVEKSRRRRGRTPTPGRYLGLKTVRVSRRSPSYSSSYDRARDRSESYSPYYRRGRSRSRSYSPYYSSRYSRGRYYSRSRSPHWSPRGRHDRYYSPYYSRSNGRSHYRSISPSVSPPRSRRSSRRYRHSYSPRRSYSFSRSPSPVYRRGSRRSYYSLSRSPSPMYRRGSRRSYSRSVSLRSRGHRDYYSPSMSYRESPSPRSVSRSASPSR